MTKELELFKRWFGWDADSIGFNYGVTIYEDTPKLELYLLNIPKEYLNLVFNKYVEELYATRPPESIGIIYNIPPAHHAEWEQYVKEKADE